MSQKQITKQLRVKSSFLIYLISLAIVAGSFFMGYSIVCLSFLQEHIKRANNNTQNPGFYLSIGTTALPIGALIGSLIYKKIVKQYGQAKTMVYADIFGIISYLIQIYSLNIIFLIIGRLLTGIVIGVSLGIIPSYLNSISPPRMTGIIGSFNQLLITIGIAVCYSMAFTVNSQSYQELVIFLSIPIIACLIRILFISCYFSYDSVETQLQKEDIQTLKKFINLIYYNATIEDLRSLRTSNDSKQPISQIQSNSNKNHNKRLKVVIFLSIANQFCGINTIFFYAKQMFDKISEGDTYKSDLLSLQLGLLQVALTLVSGMLLDRFGRKSLAVSGMSIIVISLLLGFLGDGSGNSQLTELSIFTHIIGFSLSLGPITALHAAQLLQNLTPIMVLIWIQTIFIALFSDIFISTLGLGKTFLLYAIITGFCLGYLIKFMKQTKGLTKNQIINEYQDQKDLLHDEQQKDFLSLNM